jgi:hypothetical protein
MQNITKKISPNQANYMLKIIHIETYSFMLIKLNFSYFLNINSYIIIDILQYIRNKYEKI